jgi:hypothetical protein
MIHGREADELRNGIEDMIESGCRDSRALMHLLERVDARDSLAYLEAKDDD